jgi:hypothetical protein
MGKGSNVFKTYHSVRAVCDTVPHTAVSEARITVRAGGFANNPDACPSGILTFPSLPAVPHCHPPLPPRQRTPSGALSLGTMVGAKGDEQPSMRLQARVTAGRGGSLCALRCRALAFSCNMMPRATAGWRRRGDGHIGSSPRTMTPGGRGAADPARDHVDPSLDGTPGG